MNPTDLTNIFINQSRLIVKNENDVFNITDNVINSIKNQKLSNLDKLSCGIAFLYQPRIQTQVIIEFIENQLNLFKLDENFNILNPQNLNYRHHQIYSLLIPNFYNTQFEHSIKDIFLKHQRRIVEPSERNIHEQILFLQNRQRELPNIKPQKKQPKPLKQQMWFRENDSSNLSRNEALSLELLLKSLIEQHDAFHNDIFIAIRHSTIEIENNGEFKKAQTKGFDRALIKLKEKIVENPNDKFPLDSIKDLSRCSFIFKESNDLLNFQQMWIERLNNIKNLEIFEIKNMFIIRDNRNIYAQKDIKLILGYKTPDDAQLKIEVQLLLKDILHLKTIQHMFQDITRADFGPLRLDFVQQLIDQIKNEKSCIKWGNNNPIQVLFENMRTIVDQSEQMTQNEDNLFDSRRFENHIVDKQYKINNNVICKQQDSRINQKRYTLHAHNSNHCHYKTSFSISTNEDSIDLFKIGEPQVIQENNKNMQLKIDQLCFTIKVNQWEVNIEKNLKLSNSSDVSTINHIRIKNNKITELRDGFIQCGNNSQFQYQKYNFQSNFKNLMSSKSYIKEQINYIDEQIQYK